MTASAYRASFLGFWLASAAGLPGCAAQSGGGGATVSPSGQAAPDQPEGAAEGDSADELDARKDKLVDQLRGRRAAAVTDPKTCQDLCSLATSICGVAAKLCNIADEHAGNDHYQDLCREAKRECQEAQQDCVTCVESLAREGEGDCRGAAESSPQPRSGQSSPSTK